MEGLKSVQDLESAVRKLQSSGNKRLGLDTKGASADGLKLVTVLRDLSPAADRAISKAEDLSDTFGMKLSGALLASVGALGAAATLFTGAEVLLFKLAAGAAAAANRVGELAEQTGLSVETLSAVGTAAEQNGSSLEEFASSVGFLEKKISDAAGGSKEAVADLKKLGIEPVKAVGDLDYAVGQAFKSINDYKGTAHAAGLATDAFGRSGKTLIPTITSVGGSLDEAKRQAAELGTLLSREAVQAAQKFDQAMDNLGLRVKGLAYSTGNQLVPAMTQLVTALDSLLGAAKPQLIFFFQALAGQVAYFANQIAVAAAAIEAFNGSGGTWSERFGAAYGKYVVAATSDPVKKTTSAPGGPGGGKGGGGKSLKERLAELAAQQEKAGGDLSAAESTARIDSVADLLDREKELISRQLEARLISYREYYQTLARVETDALDQERLRQLTALDRIRAELDAKGKEIDADKKLKPEEREAKKRIAETEAEAKAVPVLQKISELERERATVVARIRDEYVKTAEAAQEEADDVQRQLDLLSTSASVRTDAALSEIKARFAETRAQLVQTFGEASDEVRNLNELIGRLGDRVQFGEVSKQFERAVERLRIAEANVDGDQAREGFSDEEAERRKLEVQRQVRKQVFETVNGLEEIARRTGDPELLAAVARLRVEWEQLGVKIDEVGRSINEEIKQGLKDTLASIIRDTRSAGEALLALVNSILDQIAARVSDRIVEGIFGSGGVLDGVLGGKGQNGGAGGVGGILSQILGFPGAKGNPQTSQGSTSVLDTLPGVIKNFQSGATGGLRDVNASTKGVGAEVAVGTSRIGSQLGAVISFLPNLVPAQPSLLDQVLSAAVGAVAGSFSGGFAIGGGGADEGPPASRPTSPPVLKRSGGGAVWGPGTETSDSILARLSRGEFVVRAAAVKSVGADVLAYINRVGRLPALDLPAFALGGLADFDVPDVGDGALRPAGGDTISLNMPVTIQTNDAASFRQNEAAIKRTLGRTAQDGLRRAKTRPR